MEVTNFSPIIPQPYPWLIICDGKNQERQTLVNILDNHFKSMTIPEMRNKSICTSTKEWLVLKDLDSMDLCLLNLTSKEVVQLPRLESTVRTDICILSSLESESIRDCHVIFIDGLTFYFCQPGDKKFSEQVFEFDLEDRSMWWIPTATMFRGKVYFLTIISEGPNELFTAEFVNSSLHFTKITSKNLPVLSPSKIVDYLVESSGELLFIQKMRGGWNFNKILGFSIFRMDFSSQMWVQVNNIKGQTIFLSQPYGLKHKAISCFAKEKGIRKNSIYFTKCSDRYIYIFDLEDHSISKSLSCPIVSKHNSRLDWVMIPQKES